MIKPLQEWVRQARSKSGLAAQLARGALGVGAIRVLSLPVALAASALLARGLGPEGFGRYAFVLAVVTILSLPSGPGMSQLVTREVSRHHDKRDWGALRGILRRSHHVVVCLSLLLLTVVGLLVLAHGGWDESNRLSLLLVGVFMVPLMGLNGVRASALTGLKKTVVGQIPQLLLRPVVQLAIVGAMLVAGVLTPVLALFSQILASAAALALGVYLLRRAVPREVTLAPPRYEDRKWFRSWLPFTMLTAVGLFNTQLGILMLGLLGGDSDVAALRIAQSGAELVLLSLLVVNIVIGPYIARAFVNGKSGDLQQLSRHSARAALAVAIPIALCLIFLGRPLIQLVFGSAYVDSASLPLAILSAAYLLAVAFGPVSQFLAMCGYERDTLQCQLTALLAHIAAALVLIPQYGAVGAAGAIAISVAVSNAMMALKFVRRLKLRPTAL